ncbi:MAG TPA: hypothetical protein VG756_14165 [Pseudonocardiaceae bacterium]|nr:hypothetical protein [Pseudonocardiaceae bacterium]
MRAPDQSLREAVLRRLTVLDRIAESGEPDEKLIPLARAELTRLTDGWRLLLAVHRPERGGSCAACPRSWRHWPSVRGLTRSGWRRRWPCRVWLMAYEHLVDDAIPHQRRNWHRLHPG